MNKKKKLLKKKLLKKSYKKFKNFIFKINIKFLIFYIK